VQNSINIIYQNDATQGKKKKLSFNAKMKKMKEIKIKIECCVEDLRISINFFMIITYIRV